MNDSELDQLLKAAGTPVLPPTGFQRDVWLRIETAEAILWKPRVSRFLKRFLGCFAMPPVAIATCTAMVAIGAWMGLNAGHANQTGEVADIQSVSPFAQTHR